MKTTQDINQLISDLYKKSNSKQTTFKPLTESSIAKDPINQFCLWFKEASKAGITKPDEMALATADLQAKPSVRMVLLKKVDEDGFTFYSNYKSRKGRDLDKNKNAALLFYWPEAKRQIMIEGTVSKISPQESDAYFKSRTIESRISASVSAQSNTIKSRKELEEKWAILKELKREIRRPSHWGGYRLKPASFEFWQWRPHRLHDRISYTLQNGSWKIERLAP